MSSIVEVVAKRLGIPREKLEREAVGVWLRRRLTLVEAGISEILAKYGVRNANELEEHIRKGKVDEHPAWEDLVMLERLLKEKEKLNELLRL